MSRLFFRVGEEEFGNYSFINPFLHYKKVESTKILIFQLNKPSYLLGVIEVHKEDSNFNKNQQFKFVFLGVEFDRMVASPINRLATIPRISRFSIDKMVCSGFAYTYHPTNKNHC